MWTAIINFFGRILPAAKQAILATWAFFTSTILEELKKVNAEKEAMNDAKDIQQYSDSVNIELKRDRLRQLNEQGKADS